jgi:predicted RNA-binding Zn ribbon-like protein
LNITTEEAALDLINSLEPGGRDLLRDPAWLRETLAAWGVKTPARPSPAAVEELAALRRLLRKLAERVAAGHRLSRAELGRLNAVLEAAPVRARLEPAPHGHGYLVDMTPVSTGWLDRARREASGSFASMLRRAHPTRIRFCANPDCRRAFWDGSRNRARRWCDGAGCGNRLRVRRHRARA